jgi:hypothetical protein
VKSIIKNRTDFEYKILRPELTVNEYDIYLDYELNLDKLRELRTKKLMDGKGRRELNQLRMIRSSFIQHIHYIYQRATRRFSNEIYLWNAHIQFLQLKESRKFLDSVFGKLLALFPKNIDFWIKAATNELENKQNFLGARIFMQRALRFNSKNPKLWSKYFEIELWNVLRFQERQQILMKGEPIDKETKDTLEKPLFVVFQHACKALLSNQSMSNYINSLHKEHMKTAKSTNRNNQTDEEDIDDEQSQIDEEEEMLEDEEDNEVTPSSTIDDTVEWQLIPKQNFDALFAMHFLVLEMNSIELFQQMKELLQANYLSLSTIHENEISNHLSKCYLLEHIFSSVIFPSLQGEILSFEVSKQLENLFELMASSKSFLEENYLQEENNNQFFAFLDILMSSLLIGICSFSSATLTKEVENNMDNGDTEIVQRSQKEVILFAWKDVTDTIKVLEPFAMDTKKSFNHFENANLLNQILGSKKSNLSFYQKKINEFTDFLLSHGHCKDMKKGITSHDEFIITKDTIFAINQEIIMHIPLLKLAFLSQQCRVANSSSKSLNNNMTVHNSFLGVLLNSLDKLCHQIEKKGNISEIVMITESKEFPNFLRLLSLYFQLLVLTKGEQPEERNQFFHQIEKHVISISPLLTLQDDAKNCLFALLTFYQSIKPDPKNAEVDITTGFDRIIRSILLNVYLVKQATRKEFLLYSVNGYFQLILNAGEKEFEYVWEKLVHNIQWILKQFQNYPQLFPTALCDTFFLFFLEKLNSCQVPIHHEEHNGNAKKRKHSPEQENNFPKLKKHFLSTVVQNAHELCPNNEVYLNQLIELYREEGKHSLANHLQFKKRRFLQ